MIGVRAFLRPAGLVVLAALCACTNANVAINKNFDFTRVKRVAVIGFKDYAGRPGSGDIVTGAFEQAVLNAGYDAIERDQVTKVLTEQKFSGSLDPKMAKTVGDRLGADALLFGRITDLVDPKSSITKMDVIDDQTDPIYSHRTRHVQQADGSWADVGEDVITGYRTTHRVRREPRSVTVSGRLGVSARLVFVGNGQMIWSGSDSAETDSFNDAATSLATDILKAVKSTWPASKK
jgi:hypothetical protein